MNDEDRKYLDRQIARRRQRSARALWMSLDAGVLRRAGAGAAARATDEPTPPTVAESRPPTA